MIANPPDKDKMEVDMCSVLLAVAVFIASAPPSVSAVSSLQAQGVDLFSKALKSEDPVVCHFIGVIYVAYSRCLLLMINLGIPQRGETFTLIIYDISKSFISDQFLTMLS